MLMFALILLGIECVITFHIMKLIMEGVLELPDGLVKLLLLRIIVTPVGGFLVNLQISAIIAWLTGAGLSSGLANLGASVVIGFLMPIYYQRKYKINEIREHLKTVGLVGFINKRRLARARVSKD